jgi:ribosome-binding factor A
MSQDKRLLRLNEQFKREISQILLRDVGDPRVGNPLVTGVRVTSDLWVAKVFVRLPTDPGERRDAMEGLEAAAPFVRRRLGQMLKLRRIPEIRFETDDTLDDAMRIEALLREVAPEEEDGPDADTVGTPDPDDDLA